MNKICKDIFRAIHEGKWLSIEYKNKEGKTTKYWIAIKNINLKYKSLVVDGLHLSKHSIEELRIYIDSIESSTIIDGTYYEANQELVDDIMYNPKKYTALFGNIPNLKILNYLADCNKLDATPYQCEYALINQLDGDSLNAGIYSLTNGQFEEIVAHFQLRSTASNKIKKIKQLCLNVVSINTKKGLYVLAYRKLNFDVKNRTLVPAPEINISTEFTINGEKHSIRQFLDAEDYFLLDEFEKNKEEIKDKITRQNNQASGADDMPYIIALGMESLIDLNKEYDGILDMYDSEQVTFPIKAFFGELVARPVRKKEYSIALLNKKVNIDQLLAIQNALKYPLAYIQGPPGTGKTNTIINTITSAFFHERTVLFASYNNHPIDSVYEILRNIEYKGNVVPFPVIRLGNNEKIAEALDYIAELHKRTEKITIYDATLERNKDDKIENTKKLTALLKKHEEILDLKERKATIEKLMQSNNQMTFLGDLHGRQLKEVSERLAQMGEVTDEEALSLLENDEEVFKKYLYYISARYLKRLNEPKNEQLLKIVYMPNDNMDKKVKEFNKYLSNEENLKLFLRIFPIVATTCISAHKLGEPKPHFDMVIMDESSQCNTAVSLVPIIRGRNLMLVGDPQQLNPVILLDKKNNAILKRHYEVANEYDYIENSIYKTYLACDPVSDEVLLSYHYRCHKSIIEFNNKKYYNNKLNIKSKVESVEPLVYVDVIEANENHKNSSFAEAQAVVAYAKQNKDKKIGIITPFVNQRDCINELLKEKGLSDVTCGTVHAFQGDEKDVILFSLAITEQTYIKTYDWLKNNKELINVATSRAKEQLIVLSSRKNLERLHNDKLGNEDDVYELIEYVKSNGTSEVTGKHAMSRALGVKPYSTETEEAFLSNLNHALDNVLHNNKKCLIHKEVAISHVFKDNIGYEDLFYSGRFDFVVYEKTHDKKEIPIFAIELDGKEHFQNEIVRERDRKKNEICKNHGFELIRIENSYARRYNYVKEILIEYFAKIG